MIIDSHAHYDDRAFEEDRDALLKSLSENGIEKVVNVGASLRGCRDTVKLTKEYPFVYGSLGVHPEDVANMTEDDISWILEESKQEKIVAIGEIGLDYHYDEPTKEVQKKWFLRQMELAKQADLPVIIHSRDAALDTITLMKEIHAEQLKGVIHCYSYTKESARDYLELGYYFGIGGVLTFKNGKKLQEAVSYIPMDRILLETDAPYLAPEPFRGKRNCSIYIPYVVKKIAEIKQMPEEEVMRIAYENTLTLFPKLK